MTSILDNKTKRQNEHTASERYKRAIDLVSISSTFLRTAFALVDPKSVKVTEYLTEPLVTLSGFERVKAVRRTLMKLSPDNRVSTLKTTTVTFKTCLKLSSPEV